MFPGMDWISIIEREGNALAAAARQAPTAATEDWQAARLPYNIKNFHPFRSG